MLNWKGVSAAQRLRRVVQEGLPPAIRRPLGSLPSRIIFSVFAAALVTSLVVAWISTQSIESFLRAKIDQKFPAILRSAGDRLDLWYAQWQLDVETFARSSMVAENLGPLAQGTSTRPGERAHEEVRKYLSYVLERSSQYQSLFLLDAEGRRLLWVGAEFELPDMLRLRLAAVEGSTVARLRRLGSQRVQVASSAVTDSRGRRLASLHAVVGVEALEDVLRREGLGATGGIHVVDRNGEYLVSSWGQPPRGRHARELPALGETPIVEDYTNGAGDYVVGSALRFDRFDWTIVVEENYDAAFAPVGSVIRRVLAINLGIVGIFGLIAFQIARSVVRPIQALSVGARRIAAGETGVAIPVSSRRDELGVLTSAFNEMAKRLHQNQLELERRNQQLQRVNEMLEQLSITDGLTRLHNHRFFQDHLPRAMKRAARTGEPLALILIDIDDFKTLNDRFGHAVGDAVLRRIADVMNGVVREMDLLARYGGEEFALLASHTSLEGAVALAEKIRIAVSEARFSVVDLDGPAALSVTVSIGVAAFRGDEKAFFNDADRALYRAKSAGKDCVIAADGADSATADQ
jgi:diguanylate cyclase (GGDEF)-like protein